MNTAKVKNKSSQRSINLKLYITKTVEKLKNTNYQRLFIRIKRHVVLKQVYQSENGQKNGVFAQVSSNDSPLTIS